MLFRDRHDAGKRLADALVDYRGRGDVIVLGLPRGGVIVASEVARELNAPLDTIISRKIGAPGNPEYAIGAVAEQGPVLVDEQVLDLYQISRRYVEDEAERQRREIKRRVELYREGRSLPDLRNRTVILIDDGIATGYTMLAAIEAVKAMKPRELVVAVPVAPPEVADQLRRTVDRLICLATPEPFYAVGRWYVDFRQISDEEVKEHLRLGGAGRREREG